MDTDKQTRWKLSNETCIVKTGQGLDFYYIFGESGMLYIVQHTRRCVLSNPSHLIRYMMIGPLFCVSYYHRP